MVWKHIKKAGKIHVAFLTGLEGIMRLMVCAMQPVRTHQSLAGDAV